MIIHDCGHIIIVSEAKCLCSSMNLIVCNNVKLSEVDLYVILLVSQIDTQLIMSGLLVDSHSIL